MMYLDRRHPREDARAPQRLDFGLALRRPYGLVPVYADPIQRVCSKVVG